MSDALLDAVPYRTLTLRRYKELKRREGLDYRHPDALDEDERQELIAYEEHCY